MADKKVTRKRIDKRTWEFYVDGEAIGVARFTGTKGVRIGPHRQRWIPRARGEHAYVLLPTEDSGIGAQNAIMAWQERRGR